MAITKIILIFILFHSVHFTTSQSQSVGFSLKLIPMFSPESPLYPGNLTHSQRIQKMVEISIARAKSLQSQNTVLSENVRAIVHTKDSYYSVEVSVGTPARKQFLLLDTGSGLTWTQCQPCRNPFRQFTPLFDPHSSHSYKILPCDNPLCKPPYECIHGQCIYRKYYSGNAATTGVVSIETFTFPYNDGVRAIPDFVFGCSHDSGGVNFNNQVSGVFGLNTAPDSILSQLKNTLNGRFSYCLIHSSPQMSAISFLRFGKDADMGPLGFRKISILPQNVSPNYHLGLLDISVSNRRLGFKPKTFALHGDGSGGFIIETGSPFSLFQRPVYEVVMKAFDEYFTASGLHRVHVQGERFEYCYAQNAGFNGYTSMTLHFREADLIVKPAYMYYHESQTSFCVALFPSGNGKNILGAWQQQDTKFLFDLNEGVVRFGYANCARSEL